MLTHILNGEAIVEAFESSNIAGRHVAWREALMMGPARIEAHSADTQDAWQAMRAGYLASAYGRDEAECRDVLAQQAGALRDSLATGEVVLWFEDDLFCYVHLLYLIQWYERHGASDGVTLSLVCEGRLGERSPHELAALFAERQPLTRDDRALATRAWDAYAADTPEALVDLLKRSPWDGGIDDGLGGSTRLTFLRQALTLHLGRLPSVEHGLGRIQRRSLDLVAAGNRDFFDLFAAFTDAEPGYGLGDLQLVTELSGLLREKLLAIDHIDSSALSYRLTDPGQAVLNGTHHVGGATTERWLGGIDLRVTPAWQWSTLHQRVVRG